MSQVAIDTSRTSERLAAFLSEIHSNEPVDNVFVELPTIKELMEKRVKKSFGRQIVVPLDTAMNGSVKSFADTEAFDTSVPNSARVAVYAAKNYGGALVWTWEEIQETKGDDNKLFDVVQHRRSNLMNSLKDLVNSDLWATVVGSKDFNSIPALVSTSNSLGGIDGSSSTYWNAQETTSVGAFSANGISSMRTLYNNIKATGAGSPKMCRTTQTIYEAFENELDPDVRYASTEKLQRGAQSLMYKGMSVEFDDDIPSGHLYMLNPEWVEFWVDEAADFSIGKTMESINSMVFVAKLVLRGQLLTSQRRGNGRLTGIS